MPVLFELKAASPASFTGCRPVGQGLDGIGGWGWAEGAFAFEIYLMQSAYPMYWRARLGWRDATATYNNRSSSSSSSSNGYCCYSRTPTWAGGLPSGSIEKPPQHMGWAEEQSIDLTVFGLPRWTGRRTKRWAERAAVEIGHTSTMLADLRK